ncbi:hypothetical protein QJS10_CPB18g01455 [Acorus calamus]|uniref:Exonuclease domain-containing protein n=1 Tax=Acorus calamus TaxID=4465 RepID=A0AAV9CP48_ACOCL|nr:hypothetical protein QJS10_CPB18g01455 [Acorus calamus]
MAEETTTSAATTTTTTTTSRRDEIAFFDVETTVPFRTGQGYSLLEFGAVLVCPRRLVEVECFSTLVCPRDISAISAQSVRCNGITRDAVSSAPPFSSVADRVFDILHGRVWAGHNILRFDCPRIREAFQEIGRVPPEPRGTIDSLQLLTQRFGRRAGDMKMASLANYFGLGRQKHRSLDDVRMNIEVLKYCAMVLFLESSLPDASPTDELITADPPELIQLVDQMKIDPLQSDTPVNERPALENTGGCSGYEGFLKPEEVSISSISTHRLPSYRGTWRISIHHKYMPLQLLCTGMQIHLGLSTKFKDQAGLPKLSFLVKPSPHICHVLEACDGLAQRSHLELGSTSDWRPLIRKFTNSSTIRLQIPSVVNGDVATYSTDFYLKEPSNNVRQCDTNGISEADIESLLVPGKYVDAYIGLDVYDYCQSAGIRLVAKKLIVHSA